MSNSALLSPFHLMLCLLAVLFACSASGNSNEKKHRVCTIYPHLKDSYWLSVNYGMVQEAKKYNLDLKVFESGGYPNLGKQTQQLINCRKWKADAIILGTVSSRAYLNRFPDLIGDTPLFATVNKLNVGIKDRPQFEGEVGVDWFWMGYYAGEYLHNRHPEGSGKINVILLPGPRYSGGTKPVLEGFYSALTGSDIVIKQTAWADNDKELQRNLIQKALEEHDNIDYIVGGAVAIEAAISEIRTNPKYKDIGLVSIYLSHGVYRGLKRNKVLFAPTDKMVLQGRLSIQQVNAFFNDDAFESQLSPKIETLTPTSLDKTIIEDSLSPSEYRPTFSVMHHQPPHF